MTNENIKKHLQTIIDTDVDNSIEKAVAEEILNHNWENIQDFFTGLFNHGCVSGWVSSLVYYTDTRSFYDTHYHQIEELRQDYEDSTGTPFQIKHDLKNDFAWFAFEETAYKICQELELDY